MYNVRHAYGDVGGDANKRGRGYSPFSCQKLLTEPLPSAGLNHGCPYRTYSPDNLISLLTNVGVSDRDLLRQVREDVGRQRYHIACNRVFESTHKNEIKKVRPKTSAAAVSQLDTNISRKVKDENLWNASELDTILHPNEYFKRSFLLKNLSLARNGDLGVDGPSQGSN